MFQINAYDADGDFVHDYSFWCDGISESHAEARGFSRLNPSYTIEIVTAGGSVIARYQHGQLAGGRA